MEQWLAKSASWLVRPILPLSYGQAGYKIRQRVFGDSELSEDLSGRVALVTGANSGIGKATALALAERRAEVWLLCRNPERAEAARQDIIQQTGNFNVRTALLDLSDMSRIREFALQEAPPVVDILVHNAGVLPDERWMTNDGLEFTLATNLLGPFLLTHLLLKALHHSKEARVIHVSSGGMYTQKLDLEQMKRPPEPFDGVVQYAQTKRAMVLLNQQWAERYPDISFASMHPGWVDTPAVKTSLPRFHKLMQTMMRDSEGGADTVIWLAARKTLDGPNGAFWFDRKTQNPYPLPWTRESKATRMVLWSWCEQHVGLETTTPHDSQTDHRQHT